MMEMAGLLIPVLTFTAVLCLGGAVLVNRAARRRPVESRLSELGAVVEAPISPKGQGLTLGLLSLLGRAASGRGPSAGLRGELAKAGFYHPNASLIYVGSKLVLLILGVSLLTLVLVPAQIPVLTPTIKGVLIVWGAGVLTLVPNWFVRGRRNKRRLEVRRNLPDAIDLTEICVSAGMGLDAAWNSVTDQIRAVSPVLADEMALANLEIHLGASRAEALRHMVDRTGAEEIAALIGVLVQSDKLGTSVSDALRKFAGTMREIRSARAEEEAEKMPIKLLFPLILLIFPAVLIVLAGPAGVMWAQVMKETS
jgi:tight adherence protein C